MNYLPPSYIEVMNDIDSFIAQFLEDVEEDCGISIQREFDEFQKILQEDIYDLKGIKTVCVFG
jgi:hypothetical protein